MTVSDVILSLRYAHGLLDQALRRHALRLGCSRPEYRPRGCRAGRHVQARNSVYKHYVAQPYQKSIEPKAIPKIISIRPTDVRRHLSSPCRPTLRTISCRISSPTKVGLFNARSVASSDKSQSISTWVSELKLTAAGLVEINVARRPRHASSSRLRSAWLRVYVYTERSRPRPVDKWILYQLIMVVCVSFTATGCTLDSSTPRSTRHSNT